MGGGVACAAGDRRSTRAAPRRPGDRRDRRRAAAPDPTFTAAELAELYGAGTDWCLQVAIDVAPAVEGDPRSLADAAFWQYLRGAADFAGGRQLPV
jgi:hypothetical protein